MKDGKVLMLAVVVVLMFVGSTMASELTVTKQGCGEGIVLGEGIECDPDSEYSIDCNETYPDETILHLNAVPEDDSEFLGWLVDGEPQEGTLIIRKDITVTAIFDKKPQQVPELEIVGTRSIELAQAEEKGLVFFLSDYRGELLGSKEIIREGTHVKQIVSFNDGASFQVEPLDNVTVSKDRSRVLVFGGDISDLEIYSTDRVFIYSGTGDLITSVEIEMGWEDQFPPFALEDTGAFWIAGRKWGREISYMLKKYSKDGDLLWEESLPQKPQGLGVSLDNKYVTLLFEEVFPTGLAEIRYYQNDGTLMYMRELPSSFYGVEFIAPQKVLLYSASKWELYRLDDLDTPFVSGEFNGNPFDIIAVPQAESFLVKTFDAEPCRKGNRFQAIDAETGQVLAERFFEKESSGLMLVQVTEEGTIEVWYGSNTVMELRIPR